MGTVVYTTCQSNVLTELVFENSKRQLLPANRISQFYESNESMILSLSQFIKIIGKYISLCNSFTLSCIKFTFAMNPPGDGGHKPLTSLLW